MYRGQKNEDDTTEETENKYIVISKGKLRGIGVLIPTEEVSRWFHYAKKS